MIQTIKQALTITIAAIGSVTIIVFAWPLLFWLGRTTTPRELVVDAELLVDDPGVDVDGAEQYS